jgi:signal transduction histidine kinase
MKLGPLFSDILIADSDPAFVRKTRVVLQSAGYSVRSPQDGAAALAAIKVRPPDLCLVSQELPDSAGCDLVRRIKGESGLPFIPVIVLLKQSTPEYIGRALNAGADEFLSQPFENAELLARVRAMLRLKSTTDQLAELNATLEQKVAERTRQLQQARAQVFHAEKLASLGRLAASIAHEINNPLAGIRNYLYLIKTDLPSDAPVQADLALVERQIEVIAKLVQHLRDFSKPPRKERCLVDLNAVLNDVLTLSSKELQRMHIQVVRNLDPALPAVFVSGEQMSEVFMNLVLNARDAMPDGGMLNVTSTYDAERVQIKISDTGQGIAPEVLERMFEPFFTTKGEHGTGLGLSICYTIVQDHGGQLNVASQPGQGTIFTMELERPTNEELGHVH